MRDIPTPSQIAKLPKWAQRYIEGLIREREQAVTALNKFEDDQQESKFYFDEWVCDGEAQTKGHGGPTTRRKYVQTRQIEVDHNGIHLNVLCRDEAIDISWSRFKRGGADIPMLPRSSNQIWLVHPTDLYGWKDLKKD